MNRFNMMCGGFAGLVGLALVGSATAATTVEWDQAAQRTDYSNGVLKAGYDVSGAVTNLELDAHSAGDIRLEGDVMTLSSEGATIFGKTSGNTTFANGIVQSGSVGALASLAFEAPEGAYSTSSGQPSTSWTVLVSGINISHLTNFVATIAGTSYNSSKPVGILTEWAADGQSFTVEYQQYTSDSTIRATKLSVGQYGNDIKIKCLGYRHLTDFGKVIVTVGTQTIFYDSYPSIWPAEYSGNYSIQSSVSSAFNISGVVAQFDRQIPTVIPLTTLVSSNDLAQVAMKVGLEATALVEIADKKAFPRSGTVEVGPYGRLRLHVNMGTDVLGGMDNGVPITVRQGGVLDYLSNYQLSASRSHVILDGGELAVQTASGPTSDAGAYVHDITFRDGARITGSAIRVRHDATCWKVKGSSASSCEVALYAWCKDANRYQDRLVFDVDDVTGDGQADFVMGSTMTRAAGDAYKFLNLVKTGAGTIRLDGAFEMGYVPFVISNGTFLVNGDLIARTPVVNDFTLAGGTFAVAAGSSNEPGVLKVEATSHVSLGEDATLSFLDSSAVAWTPGARLIVDDELTQTTRLRFGTSAAGLTRAQAKAIRPASDPEKKLGELDANGYLTFVDKGGAVLIFR